MDCKLVIQPHVCSYLVCSDFICIFLCCFPFTFSSNVFFFFVPLDSHQLPRKPPLDLILGQAQECLKLMSKCGLGACAFASVEEYM